MKIYMTKAVLLLLISGSADGFAAPNNSAPKKPNKPEHVSDLRRLGNTPQPSAFKAKIPFLQGLEAPSATAPLIPRRNLVEPGMGPPMHGGPMGPMGPMHQGGPMGPPMGHPMHQGGPMEHPMQGPMGHPMQGPPGHPGMHGPPSSDMAPPNGRWGMPDMLREAPGSNGMDSDHYDAPVQGDGDGYWQQTYGDNMHAANNPFGVPDEFLGSPIDAYGSARSEYKPMYPEGENPHEEIGANYKPNTENIQQPNTRQEKKPNMPNMRQERQPNTHMPPMQEFPNAQQSNSRQEKKPNMPNKRQEQQPNMRMPPMEQYPDEQYPDAQNMPIDNFPRHSESYSSMPPMEEYAQDQGHSEGEEMYSNEHFHHQEQGPQGMYGEPFHHQEQAPQGMYGEQFHHQEQAPQGMYGEQFHHQEQAPQQGDNVWPYNVSPPGPVQYEANGFISLEDPNLVSHHPMQGNAFVPMGDPNMMNQRPMSGNEFVPMGDPNMMMHHYGRPMNGNELGHMDHMDDPNMMGPPHGHPMNDFHPMNDISPPMEEYGMYNDPHAQGHVYEAQGPIYETERMHAREPHYGPEPVYAPQPEFYQDQQQPRDQGEWFRQQTGFSPLERGHNTY